ncbi:hypothetical protein GXM_06659 [Nostoc sphaeroides CCNUC1]|uniref:Uncharacterized protein n=1 Tax=Nostoc sphaeroides CCNUC1 TaxID=2653204 RepID=A0A5P8W8T2_9NOSO|nr:hypothetical protein GXM_06659 [Nostoc sphaeroides CCNUC1]
MIKITYQKLFRHPLTFYFFFFKQNISKIPAPIPHKKE